MTATLPRSVPTPIAGVRAKRRSLFIGGAAGAAAMLALHPQPVRAQAFNGNPVGLPSNVDRNIINGTTETITISPKVDGDTSAVINWRADNTDFLPAGDTATFTGVAGFTVLNRILFGPTDANALIQLNGAVNADPGSTVIFSSPGGLLVGGTAVFNVGNLVLTTLNVATGADTGYGEYVNPGNLSFNGSFTAGTFDPNAGIELSPNAQINAINGSSYVAMVAPRIVQGGIVRVDGSVAYVAAEEAQVTINNGLFDIVIRNGTTDDTGIEHTGSTGGPSQVADENQRIYFVAVPKNQAITALLSGTIGYDAATEVGVENGAIILTAGYGSVTQGGKFGGIAIANPSVGEANFLIGSDARATSITTDLFGYALTNADANTGANFGLSFSQDVRLTGGVGASFVATGGQTATVSGQAVIDASEVGGSGVYDASGGTALVEANGGGSINFAGNLYVAAAALGAANSDNVGSGTGGSASVVADGGSISVTGDVGVFANGIGASSTGGLSYQIGGAGYGGDASVESRNSGSVTIGGDLSVEANGEGGTPNFIGVGGAGVGGTASLLAEGGSILVSGAGGNNVDLYANGEGGRSGSVYNEATGKYDGADGADGTGGEVVITASGGGSITIDGGLDLGVEGDGGTGGTGEDPGNGGLGQGGTVTIGATNAVLSFGGLDINATGDGGQGGQGKYGSADVGGIGGDGGTGEGGSVTITSGIGGEITIGEPSSQSEQYNEIDVGGNGGDGGAGGPGDGGGNGGAGGLGDGGTVSIVTTGGTIEFTGASSFPIYADGYGGYGGNGGDSYSGEAVGGDGGVGGNGVGGEVSISVTGGSVTAPGLNVDASGSGAYGGYGGNSDTPAGPVEQNGGPGSGTGGLITISVTDGNGESGSASLGDTNLLASGIGGSDESTGNVAGRVVVQDLATVAGGLDFGDLNVLSVGDVPSPDGPGFAFTSTQGPVTADGVQIYTTGDVSLSATGSGGLDATLGVQVYTPGSILLDHTTPAAGAATLEGGAINFTAGVAITGNAGSLIRATGSYSANVNLYAPAIDVGGVEAQFYVQAAGDTVAIDEIDAGASILLSSTGNMEVGVANTGEDFFADAGGTFTGGTVNANVNTDIEISSVGDLRLDNAAATGTIDLISYAGSVLSDGTLSADVDILVSASVDIDLNNGSAGRDVTLDTYGAIDVAAFTAGDDFRANAGTTFTGGGVYATGLGPDQDACSDCQGGAYDTPGNGSNIVITAGDDLTVGNASSFAGSVDLISYGGDITSTGLVESTVGTSIDADGDIALNTATSGGPISASAGGSFTAATVSTQLSGGTISITSDGDLRLDNGDTTSTMSLSSTNGSILSDGTLQANQLLASAALNLDLNDVSVVQSLFLTASNGFIAGNDFESDAGIFLDASGAITLASGTSVGGFNVSAGGDVDLGTIDAGSNLLVTGANITLDAGTAGIYASLFTDGNLAVGTVAGNNGVYTYSGGTTVIDGATADVGSIDVEAVGSATLGTFAAGTDIRVEAASISLTDGRAGRDVTLEASGNIGVGYAQAGDDFRAYSSAGTVTADTVVVTGLGEDADFDDCSDCYSELAGQKGGSGPLSIGILAADGSNIVISADGDLRLDDGSAPGVIDLTSVNGSVLSDGTLTANQLAASAAVDIALNDVFVVQTLSLVTGNGDISGNSFNSDDGIFLNASGDIDLADADAGGFFSATAGGDAVLGTIDGASGLSVSGANITLTSGTSGGFASLFSYGDLDAGTVTAANSIYATAYGDLALDTGNATTGSIDLDVGGAATLGNLAATVDIRVEGTSIDLTDGRAGRDVTLEAFGNIDVGYAQAGDDFRAYSDTGAFTAATVITTGLGEDADFQDSSGSDQIGILAVDGSNIVIASEGDLRLDDGEAIDTIDLSSRNGSILSDGTLRANQLIANAALNLTLNDVFTVLDLDLVTTGGDITGNSFNSSAGGISLDSSGLIDLAQANAETDIDLTGVGDVRLDNGTGDVVTLTSTGASVFSSGQISATQLDASAALDIVFDGTGDINGNDFTAGRDINLSAPGAIVLANADAGANIVLDAGGDITVGTADAGDDFFATAGGAFTGDTVTANVSTDIIITAVQDLRLDNGTATGLIDLTSTDGNVLSDGLLTANQLDVTASLGIDLNDVNVVTSLVLQAFDGDISGNNFTSGGSIALTATGAIDVASASAGTDLSLNAGNDLTLDNIEGENIELVSTGGSVFSDGLLDAANSVRVTAAQNIGLNDVTAGGSILLDADGDVSAGSLASALATGVTAGGAVAIDSIESDDSVFVQAEGAVELGAASAGTDIDIDGAQLTLGTLTAASDIRVFGTGDVALQTASAGDDLVVSTAGSIAGGSFTASGGTDDDGAGGAQPGVGNLQVAGDQGIQVDSATAAGNLRLAALNGNIDVAEGVEAGGLADLDAGGNVTMAAGAAIVGANVIVEAGGDATLSGVTGGDVDIDALGTARFQGAVAATTIDVASGDIDITETGSLGNASTQLVALRALAGRQGAQTVLGGTAEGEGYTLTNVEFGRIFSATVTFLAPQLGSASTRPPDLLIRDLTINGLGGANGRVGELQINTPGYARVEGAVRFTGARIDDQLFIRANDRLEVLTPTGSIEMLDAQGQLGGLLNIFSDNIVVANPQLAAQLAADPNFDGRTQALRTNTGAVAPEGYIRANGVGLFAGSTVFVQNTGTATDFAGITVGTGALIIGRLTQNAPAGGVNALDAGSFSFVGTLMTADEVLLFEFTIDAASMVTLRTYSYAGGTNAAGQSIERGGFDPILALFNAIGTLVGQNDDGGSNVPADAVTGARFDTFFQEMLQPGNYTVAVSNYPNFANGPTLDDGFEGADSFTDVTGDPRTPAFAFDILGASAATGPGATGPLDVVAFGRRKNADGTFVTNNDFFAQVDFSKDEGTTYLDLAEFNTCLINTGCIVPPEEPIIRPDPPTASQIEGPLDEGTSDEEAGGISISRTELVDVSFSSEPLIEEPVTSGADSVLWNCDRDGDGDCDEDDVDD